MDVKALMAVKHGGRRYRAGEVISCSDKWGNYLVEKGAAEPVAPPLPADPESQPGEANQVGLDEQAAEPLPDVSTMTKKRILAELKAAGQKVNNNLSKVVLKEMLLKFMDK